MDIVAGALGCPRHHSQFRALPHSHQCLRRAKNEGTVGTLKDSSFLCDLRHIILGAGRDLDGAQVGVSGAATVVHGAEGKEDRAIIQITACVADGDAFKHPALQLAALSISSAELIEQQGHLILSFVKLVCDM